MSRRIATGFTCQQQADAWEKENNKGYNASLGLTGGAFEVTIDVVKRTTNFDDPATIIAAIKATDLQTILGPIKFTGQPVPNICKTPLVGGQWVKGAKYSWDRLVTDNSNYPLRVFRQGFENASDPSLHFDGISRTWLVSRPPTPVLGGQGRRSKRSAGF